MKTKLPLFALMIIASLLSGCMHRIDDLVPPITAAKLSYTRTGKFSSTTVNVEGLKREDFKVSAAKVTIRHSNAWMPNLEITVEGYERPVTPGEQAK